ncbi:MAG TPA: protein-glutamate O-methyltransferase CheR, partial [Candidatus Aminicenantes bacterium]|nr:protein-glutamate O-methyltransferase CheR [Candidatus Aminicenantes bacterium]
MPTPPPTASAGELEFQAVEDYSSLLENRFIDLIEERSGITFDQIKRKELKLDLLTRMEARRIPSFHAYLEALLENDPVRAEFKKLVNLITINETYFMRVDEHFTMLQNEVVPALRSRRPERPLRILSAGCSSGEEVYSLVIALLEMGDRCPERFTVIGTDINEDMLYLAEKGIYRGRTLAKVPDCFLAKYFEPYRDRYRVVPRVRDHAQFRYLNLTEPLPEEWLSDLDIVFFRNVLIYFSRETTRRIIAGFHHLLREGGALFLGPSETLWDISDGFELVMNPTAYMYRKKGLAAAPAPLPRPVPPPPVPPPQPPRLVP